MNVIIPRCFAHYDEGDTVCDGDGGDDPPCGMRDRCSALKANLADKGEALVQYGRVKASEDAEGNDSSEFIPKGGFGILAEKCDQMIKEYGVKNGAILGSAEVEDEPEEVEAVEVAPVEEEKPKKPQRKIVRPYKESRKNPIDRRKFLRPSHKARVAARKALQRTAKERRKELREMLRNFCAFLAEGLPEYNWARPLEAVAPGHLYVQDRLKSSDYATIYCRTSFGRDVALTNIRVKPRDMTVILGLPFEPETLSNEARKRLNPRPFKDGVFIYKTAHLDKEGLYIAAEAVVKACRMGAIILPKARLHGPRPHNPTEWARQSVQ